MAQTPAYQRLLDNIAMHCSGALTSAVQAELFETARDFCQATNIYQQTMALTIATNTYDYPLTVPTSAAIKRIIGIRNKTNLSEPPYPVFQWPYGLVLPNTLRLERNVNNTYNIEVLYSLYPVDPTDAQNEPVIPEFIVDNYFDALFSGALWRLYAQASKPYSNPGLAATRYRMYMKGRGLAAVDALRQNIYNAQAWCYPGNYATYGRQRGV